MTALLAILRPYLVPLIIAGVGLIGIGIQTWRLRGAQIEIAEATTSRAKLTAQVEAATAANSAMARQIDAQSRAIATLEAQAKAKEAKAATVGRKALARPTPLPEGHGPAAMNQWMKSYFK